MKKEKRREYEFFYAELPQTDYLNDIEIQDEYEDPTSDNGHTTTITRGLSDEQVSQIAQDSLENAHRRRSQDNPDTTTDSKA